MHPMDSVISKLGVFSDIRLGGTGVMNDGSYYVDNKKQEGSIRLPGGIIMKWARLPASGNAKEERRYWTYAYPFPSDCIMAFSVIVKNDQLRDAYAYGYPMSFDRYTSSFSAWGSFISFAIAFGW